MCLLQDSAFKYPVAPAPRSARLSSGGDDSRSPLRSSPARTRHSSASSGGVGRKFTRQPSDESCSPLRYASVGDSPSARTSFKGVFGGKGGVKVTSGPVTRLRSPRRPTAGSPMRLARSPLASSLTGDGIEISLDAFDNDQEGVVSR